MTDAVEAHSKLKILALDIEIMPAAVWTYDLWQPIIGHRQIISPSRIMCYSAQWVGTKKTLFDSEHHNEGNYLGMLKGLYDLVSEADVIMGWNSKRFDWPWIEGSFLLEGWSAPPPVKHIDMFQVAKQHSRFLSRKLDYVSELLLKDRKIDVNTMQLALECNSQDAAVRERAWNKMRRYSIKDTKLLLPLFDEMKSFIKMPHPADPTNPFSCHSCGSNKLQKRGTAKTLTGHYQRLVCRDCGSWFRETKRVASSEIRAI